MRFFFPDSQDQVDPGFDFVTEERDPFRVRQRDDLYAHEIFTPPPFDGLLVSKAIVDGRAGGGAGKYTGAQRHRLYRVGAKSFFRLSAGRTRLEIMGDCGAFSYVREEVPPYTVDEVIDFYDGCGFDYGISVDHVIFQFEPTVDRTHPDAREWVRRQEITLALAEEFLRRSRARKTTFVPIGVAQGWSPASYADAVQALQRMGYRRIALGGMVPLDTAEIVACLAAVDEVRRRDTQLHLLGISRPYDIPRFATHGVTSFDSTSPFLQAFKDDKDNYHTPDRSYLAVRVPQVGANTKLKARILAGQVGQATALRLERAALDSLRQYDQGEIGLAKVLDAVIAYDEVWDGRSDRTEQYRQVLEDRPWRKCGCYLCAALSVEIIIFRGTERNKRRGFHNLFVFGQRMREQLGKER